MPHYIAESRSPNLFNRGSVVEGVQTMDLPGVFLYVLCTDENPKAWPQSNHETSSSDEPPRRAPPGVNEWWVVCQGAQASWPGTKLRSSPTPIDLAGLPEHHGKEPMIHWP